MNELNMDLEDNIIKEESNESNEFSENNLVSLKERKKEIQMKISQHEKQISQMQKMISENEKEIAAKHDVQNRKNMIITLKNCIAEEQ